MIYIIDYLYANSPENPNIVMSWEKSLLRLPDCKLKSEIIELSRVYVIENLSEGFVEGLPQPFRKGSPNPKRRVTQTKPKGLPKSINNKQLTINNKQKDTPYIPPGGGLIIRASQELDIVQRIFDHWRNVMGHPRAQLDESRKRYIKGALKWGYTEDDLMQAIEGCAKTPWNMEFNKDRQRNDGLHIILKDGGQIDRFMGNFIKPPIPMSEAQRRTIVDRIESEEWANKTDEEMARVI